MSKEDIFAEMEADAGTVAKPTDELVSGIAGLVTKQMDLEDAIGRAEEHLKTMKKDLEGISTRDLPDALTKAGLAGWIAVDGSSVVLKSFASASITKAKAPEAHKWLRDNKHGDLIKHILAADIGRDPKLAKKAAAVLTKAGVPFSVSESVHAQTLKAFVREQVGAGKPIPLELFGAFLGQKSTIKRSMK